MAHLVVKGIKTLELLVSLSAFPGIDAVDSLIKDIQQGKKNKEDLERQAAELNKMLLESSGNGQPDLSFFSSDLLKAIDSHAVESFKTCKMKIGLADDVYITQLNTYVRAVIRSMEELQKGHPCLSQAKAKLRWLLFGQHTPVPYPIMTISVVQMLVESFKQVANAVNEVAQMLLRLIEVAETEIGYNLVRTTFWNAHKRTRRQSLA